MDEPTAEDVLAAIGAQEPTLPPAYLVPVDVATSAALHFLKAEEPDPMITWDRA